MKLLPRLEEILLLAIWKLGDGAYGLAIVDQVEKDTGISWLTGSIYGALNRLKKTGRIAAVETGRSPEKTGRPRIYYRLTSKGMDKLIAMQKINRLIWLDVPDLGQGR